MPSMGELIEEMIGKPLHSWQRDCLMAMLWWDDRVGRAVANAARKSGPIRGISANLIIQDEVNQHVG